MELRGIQTVINMTGLLAISLCLLMTVYGAFLSGIGILLGAGWGCINLYFLKKLLQEMLLLRNGFKLLIWMVIKCPMLYVVGYGLLKIIFFPLLSLVSGFSLILVAILIKGLRCDSQMGDVSYK